MDSRFEAKVRRILDIKSGLGSRGRRFVGMLRSTFVSLMPGIVDQELSAKLESELQMEKDMRDSDEYPESIKDYLDNGPFEVRLSQDVLTACAEPSSSYKIRLVKKKWFLHANSAMRRKITRPLARTFT